MKFEIKNRWNGGVLFSAEIADDTAERFRFKVALEIAVKAGADLAGADLAGADLAGAYLAGAYLAGAYLAPIRDDLWAVLSSAPAEVVGLRNALAEGRVDGSTYTGECACLVGTIANVRGCDVASLGLLKPNSDRPAERFIMLIKPGDTPEKSEPARLALDWVDTWLTAMRAAFGGKQEAA